MSVTENIDETPSGLLLHGIMSSIAEFYSRNLAAEVIKGTQQKVRAGGTATRAPIGYRNVRKLVDGYETRTVELDEARSGLIRWAFEAYASGEWSGLNSLAAELERMGLTFRAGPKTPERRVPANKLHEILRNRYHIGFVTWRGIEYDGKHPRLADAETFEQVQRTLVEHRTAGDRACRNNSLSKPSSNSGGLRPFPGRMSPVSMPTWRVTSPCTNSWPRQRSGSSRPALTASGASASSGLRRP